MFGVMAAGLSLVYADDFSRSFTDQLGNNWAELQNGSPTGPWGPWTVSANQARRHVTGTPLPYDAIYRPEVVGDQYAECVPINHGIGPVVRFNPGSIPSGYYMTSSATNLFLESPGGVGHIDTIFGTTVNLSTDVLKIEVLGDRVNGYKNGVLVISGTETVWATGHAGIGVMNDDTNDLRADSFSWGA